MAPNPTAEQTPLPDPFDADGVALAAIMALIEQNQSLAHRVNELEKQNQHIEGLVMLMVSELAV